MNSERQAEDEAPVDDDSRTAKWRQLLLSAGLRVIDSISGFLSRLRNRIEAAPGDGNSAGDGGRKAHPDSSDVAAPQVVAAPKRSRLIRFFIFTLVLMTGTIGGAAISYRLLSKAINSSDVTIENLRDELAEMKKQGSLNLKQITEGQQMIRDYDKSATGYLKELEDSKAQVAELRSQLDAVKNARRDSASQSSRSSPVATATAKRAASQKTGTCTMDSAKDAANLAHCIEEFNRK
jgi:hypothetical protein